MFNLEVESEISVDIKTTLKMVKSKTDPLFTHHYIIGVAIHNMNSSKAGMMFLKYNPVHFTNEDIEKVQDAVILSREKIYKVTSDEARRVTNCEELIATIHGLKLAAKANDATLHHFFCEFEISDAEQWFDGYVNNANHCKSVKEQLMDAKIK